VTSSPSSTSDQALLLQLLAAVERCDDSEDSTTNDVLAHQLAWTADAVADYLAEAKDRMLLWGVRTGGTPKPCFEDLELTVQGRRLLAAGAPDSGDSTHPTASEGGSAPP
jgi:hypothetical protein